MFEKGQGDQHARGDWPSTGGSFQNAEQKPVPLLMKGHTVVASVRGKTKEESQLVSRCSPWGPGFCICGGEIFVVSSCHWSCGRPGIRGVAGFEIMMGRAGRLAQDPRTSLQKLPTAPFAGPSWPGQGASSRIISQGLSTL